MESTNEVAYMKMNTRRKVNNHTWINRVFNTQLWISRYLPNLLPVMRVQLQSFCSGCLLGQRHNLQDPTASKKREKEKPTWLHYSSTTLRSRIIELYRKCKSAYHWFHLIVHWPLRQNPLLWTVSFTKSFPSQTYMIQDWYVRQENDTGSQNGRRKNKG